MLYILFLTYPLRNDTFKKNQQDEMAMHVLGLTKDDFIPKVKDVLGVATFLNLSKGGQTLFI